MSLRLVNLGVVASGGGNPPLPALSDIIFQHNMYDGVVVPQVGSGTYTRTGSAVYATTNSLLAEVGADVMPAGAALFGGTGAGKGAQFHGPIVNQLVHSEDFTDVAWVAVGGGTASANTATDPMGTSVADTISGAAPGDGLYQESGRPASEARGVFTVFLKTSAGNGTVYLRVTDDSNSEIGFTECPITTTWKRFECVKLFTAAATGNMRVHIVVGNSSNVRVWGAQLEDWNYITRPAGWRLRMRSANAYVRSDAAPTTCGASSYVIPNATISQADVRGAIAMWVMSLQDPNDVHGSGGEYLFKIAGDTCDSINNEGQHFYYNTDDINCGVFSTKVKNEWVHWAFAWDSDAAPTDFVRVYRNGALLKESLAARAALNIGVNDMKLGGTDNLDSADSLMAQAVIWKRALTDSEVLQAYLSQATRFRTPTLSAGKLFSVSLGTSLIPTVGAKDYWYEHGGSVQYFDTPTTAAFADEGELPQGAHPLNGFNKSGFAFTTTYHNSILQSEAPATTWSVVGTGVPINSVDTFGVIALGSLTAVANDDGIEQSTAIAAASKDFTASVYVKTTLGTVSGKLTIEGDSGGTPETTTTAFVATTTVEPIAVWHNFSAGATGNVKMKITLDSAGDVLLVGGMMLTQTYADDLTPPYKIGVPYIKTTAAVAADYANQLIYPGKGNINPLKGTIVSWGFLCHSPTEFYGAAGPTPCSMTGNLYELYTAIGPNAGGVQNLLYHADVNTGAATWTKNQWSMFCWTWDTEAGLYKAYIDGVKTFETPHASLPISTKNLWIGDMSRTGSLKDPGSNDVWLGGLDLVEIYGHAFTDAEVRAMFNSTQSTYGVLKDSTDASFLLMMREKQTPLTDLIGGTSLILNNADGAYGILGTNGYNPGIQMAAVAGGYRTAVGASIPGLSFGTGDGNIFLEARADGALGALSEIFVTTVREVGTAGFSVRARSNIDVANSNISLQLIATDSTTVTLTWDGAEAGDAIWNGGVHSWEFQIDRAAGTVDLLVDTISQGTKDISALAGLSLDMDAAGKVGLCSDNRGGIDRNIPMTVWFVRVKKTVT